MIYIAKFKPADMAYSFVVGTGSIELTKILAYERPTNLVRARQAILEELWAQVWGLRT